MSCLKKWKKKKLKRKRRKNNMITLTTNKENILDPAHDGDAGYDIIADSDPKIVGEIAFSTDGVDYYRSVDYIEYETNVAITPEEGFHTFALPRSSISKMNLVLCNSVGLIDGGYTGTIKFRFKYVSQPYDLAMQIQPSEDSTKKPDNSSVSINFGVEIDMEKIYKKGDRIGQLVFSPTTNAELIQLVGDLEETTRGAGGFGSTGL
jgi:dUTPase